MLVWTDVWSRPGGWDAALWFRARSWVAFAAYLNVIDVEYVG
ncbi:hypothetical protein ABZ890_41875 [Streptomyces sp. NPDC046984]